MTAHHSQEKKYVLSLHKIHATSFPENDLEEKLTRWVRKEKERADPEEFFSDHKIVEVVRITTDKKYGLDFLEEIIVKRDDNKPYSFSKADFKYLSKNDIEDMYYLCLNGKVRYLNLTTPTMTILGINELNPYSTVDVPFVCIIYLNNKEEKRIIGLTEIPKFCDATLEKVLKEVKLKIVES
ncbi:hypothetical protein Tco_0874531 [Tanacetum coccineum]|uniref:Uncharacterized protein n=1 Tax=Tanacetum coccineum TaxID=301880 RepID=A0ABQ5BLU6_9ASTR